MNITISAINTVLTIQVLPFMEPLHIEQNMSKGPALINPFHVLRVRISSANVSYITQRVEVLFQATQYLGCISMFSKKLQINNFTTVFSLARAVYPPQASKKGHFMPI